MSEGTNEERSYLGSHSLRPLLNFPAQMRRIEKGREAGMHFGGHMHMAATRGQVPVAVSSSSGIDIAPFTVRDTVDLTTESNRSSIAIAHVKKQEEGGKQYGTTAIVRDGQHWGEGGLAEVYASENELSRGSFGDKKNEIGTVAFPKLDGDNNYSTAEETPVRTSRGRNKKGGRGGGRRGKGRKNLGPVDADVESGGESEEEVVTEERRRFNNEDALLLEKACVEQSMLRPSQREKTFWEGVEVKFNRGANGFRSGNSLRCFWARLARECTHYIAAQRLVQRSRMSGYTAEGLKFVVMEQYRRIAGKREFCGQSNLAPPFKFF